MPKTICDKKQKLLEELKDKDFRDAFVSEHIDTGIPFQIRSLRNQRDWSQEYLAKKAGMKQESISRNENPNYGKLSLSTLKKLASAFDVGLIVRFVSLGDVAHWDIHLSSESLKVPSFNEDPYFLKEREEELTISDSNQYKEAAPTGTSGNMIDLYHKLKTDSSVPENKILVQEVADEILAA